MIAGRRAQWVALTAALSLQLALIVFGIVRTDTVVRVNNIFPFADKLWHCIYYALLGLLLWHASRRRWLLASVLLASFAIVDEAIQAITPGRSASPIDLLVDIGVGICAIGISRYLDRAACTS